MKKLMKPNQKGERVKMKKLIVMILSLCLCWAGAAFGAELVLNGSFEEPVVDTANGCYAGGTGWDYCYTEDVPGWTVEWVSVVGYGNLEFHNAGVGLGVPYLGNQYVEMDTHGSSTPPDANVSIYQDFMTCGGDYTISYAWRPRPGVTAASMKLEVYWDGQLVATHIPLSSSWTEENLVMSTSLGTHRLEFKEVGTGDQLGTFLDAVSVQGANAELPNACTSINIKLGSDPNSINTCSGGVTPVTIWGSEDFDVSMIDPYMITFASAQVKTVGKSNKSLCSIEDVGSPDPYYFDGYNPDPDGYPDMTCHFVTSDLGLDSSTTAQVSMTVCANGFNNGCIDTDPVVTATDSINIVKDCDE
jgi:hypothetical protein